MLCIVEKLVVSEGVTGFSVQERHVVNTAATARTCLDTPRHVPNRLVYSFNFLVFNYKLEYLLLMPTYVCTTEVIIKIFF